MNFIPISPKFMASLILTRNIGPMTELLIAYSYPLPYFCQKINVNHGTYLVQRHGHNRSSARRPIYLPANVLWGHWFESRDVSHANAILPKPIFCWRRLQWYFANANMADATPRDSNKWLFQIVRWKMNRSSYRELQLHPLQSRTVKLTTWIFNKIK